MEGSLRRRGLSLRLLQETRRGRWRRALLHRERSGGDGGDKEGGSEGEQGELHSRSCSGNLLAWLSGVV